MFKTRINLKMNEENVSKEEKIGFHKGALSTLSKERQEFIKLTGIVEQLMQMHVKALEELGVNLQQLSENKQDSQPNSSQPIDDIIKKENRQN